MAARTSSVGYWFVTPAIFLMIFILIVPVFVAAAISFTDYSLGNTNAAWVGWENYNRIVSRSTYTKMLIATGTYVGLVVPISIALGLGAALLINSVTRFGDLYKTIYFLPVMAALLAMAIVWEFSLHPSLGIVNKTFASGCEGWPKYFFSWGWLPGTEPEKSWYAIGCRDGFPLWFGDKAYTMWTISFIGIWQAFGFNMVLYLAGLTSVPRELYHAAEMDGAVSAWDRFRLVTWPMLGPTTVFVVTISTIRSFQVFDTVEAITEGGPAKSTFVMMFAIYEKAIQHNLMGMGSAITVVFLIFVLLLTFGQRYLIEKRVHYS
ncbi:MAG: carbohydrate ABC transporter permease [Alphaproteobacteria bacterium]